MLIFRFLFISKQKLNTFFQSKSQPRLWTSKLNGGAAKVINTKPIAKTLICAEKLFTEVSIKVFETA